MYSFIKTSYEYKEIPYSQEELHRKFAYDNGLLYRKYSTGLKLAGTLDNGRIRLTIKKKHYFAHRIIWKMIYGKDPEFQIDHIDQDKMNNKIENLRDVPANINLQNNKRIKDGHIPGVYKIKKQCQEGNKKFSVIISITQRINVGYFYTEEEANEAVIAARKKYHI